MTSTITETKTIATTDFLDKFREIFEGKGWCDSAEGVLSERIGVTTFTITERPCSCGVTGCDLGGKYTERTEPRWSYVSGPKTLDLETVGKAIKRAVRDGEIGDEDGLRLAEAVGIKDLYPPAQFWTVTMTVKSGPRDEWPSEGPDDYQIRNAIRYGRYSDKSLTKVEVIEGKTA